MGSIRYLTNRLDRRAICMLRHLFENAENSGYW
jgi:hypothetical protein